MATTNKFNKNVDQILKDIAFGFIHQQEKENKIPIPMMICCMIIEILDGIYEYFEKEGDGYELSDHGTVVTNLSNEHIMIHQWILSVDFQPMRLLLKSDVAQKHEYTMKILKNGPSGSIKMVSRQHAPNAYDIIEYAHVGDGSLWSSFDDCARIRGRDRRKYTAGDRVTYTIDLKCGKIYGVVNNGDIFKVESNVKIGSGINYYFGVALGHIGDSVKSLDYKCYE